MKKYVIESIGYNDGHPYLEWEGSVLSEAVDALEHYQQLQPKVSHRLIQIIQEAEKLV